ncbi:hypothetical protein [Phyllobacterium bourgognense]|uniref:hypothetical protein n=1 Tax=Phyllobacterium bourgognense TaxID=314236 RepID=UPI003CCAEA42
MNEGIEAFIDRIPPIAKVLYRLFAGQRIYGAFQFIEVPAQRGKVNRLVLACRSLVGQAIA